MLTTCAQSLEPRLLAFTEEQRGPMRAIVLCTIRLFLPRCAKYQWARVMAMRRIDCLCAWLAYHHCNYCPFQAYCLWLWACQACQAHRLAAICWPLKGALEETLAHHVAAARRHHAEPCSVGTCQAYRLAAIFSPLAGHGARYGGLQLAWYGHCAGHCAGQLYQAHATLIARGWRVIDAGQFTTRC